MKKSDLKKILKPIIKECINEVLLEQGLLSTIITEVARGLQPMPLPMISSPRKEISFQQEQLEEEKYQQLKEQKRKLLDAAGFKTDVFAGTEPISGGITVENKDRENSPEAALSGVDPHDAGVDISGLMSLGGRNWGKMI